MIPDDNPLPSSPSGFSLRPPIPADYQAMASWIADAGACAHWAGPQLPFPFGADELPALLGGSDASSHSLVDASAAFVGFGQIVTKGPDLLRLARIIVTPHRRGQGIGRILCEHLIAAARQRPGIATLSLGVYRDNPAARALYANLGFAEAPPHPREEVLTMQLRLSPPPSA